MNLPNCFVNAEYDSAFLSVYSAAFKALLVKASSNAKSWEALLKTLNCHGLLQLSIHKKPEQQVVDWDATRLGDLSYRRYLIRELSKPIPYDFEHRSIKLQQSDMSDEKLLDEAARILSYMLAAKIFPSNSHFKQIVLLHIDADLLKQSLSKMNRAESTADGLADFILQMKVMESVDKLDLIKNFQRSLDKSCIRPAQV